jgi:hypothetical protein
MTADEETVERIASAIREELDAAIRVFPSDGGATWRNAREIVTQCCHSVNWSKRFRQAALNSSPSFNTGVEEAAKVRFEDELKAVGYMPNGLDEARNTLSYKAAVRAIAAALSDQSPSHGDAGV